MDQHYSKIPNRRKKKKNSKASFVLICKHRCGLVQILAPSVLKFSFAMRTNLSFLYKDITFALHTCEK